MKLLSATLLLLSSNAGVVFGSSIRGSGLGKEQEHHDPTHIAVSLIISFAWLSRWGIILTYPPPHIFLTETDKEER